jgi:hypothetical protein
MSREETDDSFFTYDLIVDDFKEENAVQILKTLQENAPDTTNLKDKLFRTELPFIARTNTTI